MTTFDLKQIVHQHGEQLQFLAEAWLAAGAQVFGLWVDGEPVQFWGDSPPFAAGQPTLQTVLHTGYRAIGELRVVGLNSPAAQQRLQVDAQMLTHLLRLEDELDEMTAELIENQDRLRALYDFALSMREHVDIPATLESQARTTARLVDAQASFVLIDTPDGPTSVSYPTPLLNEEHLLQLLVQVQQNRRELFFDRESNPDSLPREIDNLLVVPILIDGAIIAALGLFNQPQSFPSPVLHMVRAISEQVSAQIENVLLHQETLEQTRLQTEMNLATEAQLQLLPHTSPRVTGLDIYAETIPALHVGGDFYDFIVQKNRPFIFSIGDVAGKGMSAALLMAMSRIAIRSKANYMPNVSPENILSRSNDDLQGDFNRSHKFATAFVGLYDAQMRYLSYTNAGHSPVIYRPPGGPARMLDASGPAMGIVPLVPYRSEKLVMTPGSLLIAATDGFSEALNPERELFGFERLIELADDVAALSAADIARTFFDAVKTFEAGYRQEDDQTLIVLKAVDDPTTAS